MARETFESWIPVEYSGSTIQRPDQLSLIEQLSGMPMNSTTKVFPRSGSASVGVIAKGSAFPEDAGVNDSVTLTARKLGTAFRIAKEDLEDSVNDITTVKKTEWAVSYSKFIDNAALGVTAAENGTTIPFTSLYRALSTAGGGDANTGYTAGANITQVSAAGTGVTYASLSNTLSKVEASDWFDQSALQWWMAPQFLALVRNIVDTQGRPIFDTNPNTGQAQTLMGYPIKWTQGARATAVASFSPVGNPLACLVNPNFLMRGDRSNTETYIDSSASILTDEVLMLFRARKAFKVTVPGAHAILELTP